MLYSGDQNQYTQDRDYKAELKQDWRGDRACGEKPRQTATLVGRVQFLAHGFLGDPNSHSWCNWLPALQQPSPRCMIQCVPCVISFY